ncbi:hypothetical protein V6Z12_D08G010200 [Gossypium hirsutum]
MLNSGNNLSRGNAGLSSDMPPLPQCLPLEPISLGSQKYTRSGELSRVLGVPLRNSTSEDHSFGVSHPKPSPPVATEELKNFKESVQDTSRKARDRVKKLRESISKLERYREALSSKKRQRSDISSERTSGVSITKMGSQIHRNGHDLLTQRLEDRPKSMGLNKRVRTSVADLRADNRTAVNPRQQGTIEKDGDVPPAINGGSARIEEKIRRLPGEGWETKMKRKRSVAAVGNRVAGGDRDIKRVIQPKLSSESKLRSCDIQGFRSKSSPGVGGIRKSDGSFEVAGSDASTVLRNELESTSIPRDRAAMLEQRVVVKANTKATLQDDNQASGPSTMLKGKGSRAPRTGSIMVLDSSSKGSSHAMSQWGGQRPHKNSRTRRANLLTPTSNAEAQISNQGFATPDFGARASIGTGGSVLGSNVDNVTPRIKREPENVSSPFGFSESEESGAGDNKSKEKGIDCSEVTLPASQKAGSFLLPTRKNKMSTIEIGDGVRRQGRTGSSTPSLTKPGVPPMREKLENITTKPIQSARSASDKNRSKTGRPPSKKLKDRKATARVGLVQNNVSSDFTGESDDDRDELFAAATSARNANSLACTGPFWKKMGSMFNSVSSEDTSFLRQQLNLAEGLDESLSQMFGDGYTVLGGVVPKDAPTSVEETAKTHTSTGGFDLKQFDKVTPLCQRVLSALIEEDESEEIYNHIEAKNMSLHYASDDSHCGSCNQMDVESKDRDRMESEVESNADFQCQKNSLLDRLSYDASVASNTFRNSSMSNSLHSSERWLGEDECLHSDMGPVSEICSTDLGQVLPKEINVSAVSSLDGQYQFMSMEDKLVLELHSIGIYPETLPELTEGEEAINQNVVELNENLYQQIQKKKKKLGKIDKAIQNGREVDRRNIEYAAMDQLVQMANKKRLACRGSNSSKSAVRKVSKQVALSFIKRTLDRCRKFEQTGNSCFSEPALQDIMFSVHPCSNEAKSVEGAVCGTFERYDSPDALLAVHSTEHAVSKYGSTLNKGRKREVLIDDVVGSASSRVTPALDGTAGGLRGNRSERDSRNTSSVSGAGRTSLDGAKGDRRTKAKPKQKSGHGFNGRLSDPLLPPLANSNKMTEREARSLSPTPSNVRPKESDEPDDFANLQLNDLDPMEELGVSNDIGGPQDLSSWLNFDEDGLQDHDSIGLEIPMDDLSELKFAF